MSDRDAHEGLSAEVLDSLSQLSVVEADWRSLAEARGNAFITPEWFQAWQSVYGADSNLAVAVSRRANGSVAGVLPLVAARAAGLRVLRFAGDNLGDVFHPAAGEGEEAAAAAAGLAAISGRMGTVGLVFEHVESERRWIQCAAGGGFRRSPAYRSAVLPFVDVEGLDFDGYLAQRSRNFRSQVRRKTRALIDGHGARFRMTTTTEELDRDIETFFRLHEERWSGRGGSGALTERSRAFHRRFAALALSRGWLRLWSLEADSEPVASWYGWKLGDVYSYYQAGFARSWADRSVGFVLLAQTIKAATEEGARIYDLLLGSDDYKARFATGQREVETLVAASGWHPGVPLLRLEGRLWRARNSMSPEMRERIDALYGTIAKATPARRRR